MKNKDGLKPVQNYREFTKELREQLNVVKILERQFFCLEELCEWSIKNDATCINEEGERVSIVADCFDGQQIEVYDKLRKAVHDLDMMLESGESCFKVGS